MRNMECRTPEGQMDRRECEHYGGRSGVGREQGIQITGPIDGQNGRGLSRQMRVPINGGEEVCWKGTGSE